MMSILFAVHSAKHCICSCLFNIRSCPSKEAFKKHIVHCQNMGDLIMKREEKTIEKVEEKKPAEQIPMPVPVPTETPDALNNTVDLLVSDHSNDDDIDEIIADLDFSSLAKEVSSRSSSPSKDKVSDTKPQTKEESTTKPSPSKTTILTKKCSICLVEEEENNTIIQCVQCGACVHPLCYGLPLEEMHLPWKCDV